MLSVFPYSPGRCFDLATDVEQYPQFLPWWVVARVSEHDGEVYDMDRVAGGHDTAPLLKPICADNTRPGDDGPHQEPRLFLFLAETVKSNRSRQRPPIVA